MNEERASALYEELRRKGGGAAKFKQGLGYGASLPSQAPTTTSFPTFVKGDSHDYSLSKQEKETRLAVVRDKLTKRPAMRDNKADVDEDTFHCNGGPRHHGSQSRDIFHTPDEHDECHGPCSQSGDRGHSSRRGRCNNSSHSKEHGSQSRSSSRSPDLDHGRTSSKSSHRYSRHSRSPSYRGQSRSWSGSPDRRKWESLARSRRRSRSPKQSSRRSRCGSPSTYTSKSSHRLHGDKDSRRSSHRIRRSLSPCVERKSKSESQKEDTRSVRKSTACDYSNIIPGYDDMTPAEKVREKMKLQLSETASKDTAKGIDCEWERFVFNKSAPLDDDAKLDYFGDGTGSHDDTGFLQNTGSSFLSTCSQARREAQIQAAHDAAIFGPPSDVSAKKMGTRKEFLSLSAEEATRELEHVVQAEDAPVLNNLLSDQVLTLQRGGSWRERALKLNQQKSASATT